MSQKVILKWTVLGKFIGDLVMPAREDRSFLWMSKYACATQFWYSIEHVSSCYWFQISFLFLVFWEARQQAIPFSKALHSYWQLLT